MRLKYFLLLITVFCVSTLTVSAQEKVEKETKNVLKYNISNPLVFGIGSVIFGYERVISPKQTITVNFGRAVLPSLSIAVSDSFNLSNNKTKGGIHFSTEYRFYLSKENKYKTPHGVYIGPYYSYNHFNNSNNWNIKSATFNGAVTTDLTMNIHTIGFELGYQFFIGKRLTLDMILGGPGFAFFNLDANINGNLSVADRQEVFKRVNEKLGEKIPGYNLIVIDKNFQSKGNTSTTIPNFRYLFQLGFRL